MCDKPPTAVLFVSTSTIRWGGVEVNTLNIGKYTPPTLAKENTCRLFRFLTQSQIPSFLGMSGNVQEDKKYIMAHLDEFKLEGITPNIISFVSGFLNSSRYCTSEEAKMLADSLYSM